MLKILALFVDRKPEMAKFRLMLAGEIDERILLITESGETGKTWFLLRLFYECEEGTVPVALVDFDRRRTNSETNYLGIAHTISRHLGERCTPHICACEQALSRRGVAVGGGTGRGGGVDFGKHTRFDKAEIDAASRDHIHDVNINYAEAPLTADQLAQQRADMGRALRDDLIGFVQEHERVVLLMDTFEYADEETCTWLERWLLEPMRRQLSRVLLVVAGQPRCRLFFDRPTLWSGLITSINRFTPLDEEDVRNYSRRRGLTIPKTELPLLLDMARAGGPSAMADACDLLMQSRGGER